MLLAAEAPSRVRSEDPQLRERDAEELRQRLLKLERMLDRAPDGQLVSVRLRDERVRFDREVGDHRELVLPLDHVVRVILDICDVAPAEVDLGLDIGVGERLSCAERRILDERGVGGERRVDRVNVGQNLVLHLDEGGAFFRGLLRVGGHRCHRFAVVVDRTDSENRTVLVLGPEPWHRLRKIVRRHDESNTGHLFGLAGVDRDDPCLGFVDRDEFGVQLVHEMDVGHVLLGARDSVTTSDAVRRRSDIRVGCHALPAFAATRTASVICR